MGKKNTKSLVHKVKLSQSDQKLLARYSALHKIGENTAIKKILKDHLQNSFNYIEPEAENQLGLFDTFQMNIFD